MSSTHSEDRELEKVLEKYLHRLRQNMLTCEEKLNLVEFFVNDPTNLEDLQIDAPVSFSSEELQRFLTLGWYVSSLMDYR